MGFVRRPIEEIWSDLHHLFIKDSVGAVKKVFDIESVKTSVHNILCTRPGERVMLPEFAASLQDILFEPMQDELLDFMSRDVKEVIERWDPRVSVEGIDFFADADRNEMELSIQLNIKGFDKVFTINQVIKSQ